MVETDDELFAVMRGSLFSAVLGDILDVLGFWHQFLPQPIQPLRGEMRLAGRAMPVQIADLWGRTSEPFGRMTEALDQMQRGEVYLATGGSMHCAAWGEIMTATAKTLGAAGSILDGFHRDTPQVLEQDWPVFSRGRFAQDAGVRSKVVDVRCRVEIGGVGIEPGDLLFGDLDGVVVIPRRCEGEVVERALEKARAEEIVRREIEAGLSSTEAFRKHGIL